MKHKQLSFLHTILLLIGVTTLTILPLSCNSKDNKPLTIQILYDIPDLALAIELYGTLFPQKQIIPVEFSNSTQLIESDVFVLSQESLNTSPFAISTISKPFIVENNTVKKHLEHSQLLSFSIPLLIIKKTHSKEVPNTPRITLNTLQTLIQKTTIISNKTLSTFGFVPTMSDMFDTFFDSKEKKDIWITQTYGNYKEIQELYQKSFSPVPYIAQLKHNNIIYKLVSSNFFFDLPFTVQEEFYYFLLTRDDGKIPTLSGTYIGLEKNNAHQKNAHHFINWLFQTNTQIALIKQQKTLYPQRNIHRFLQNTLSTNWNTNMYLFAQDTWFWNNQPLLHQIK